MLAGNKVMLILGNSHNITSEELGQIIGSLIKPSVQRDAAKQIQELVKNDPIIEDMITSMQTRPLSGSYVTLELKDDIRDKAEKDYINGKLDVDAAKQLLEKPENRRLQSISVIESGEYSEGFSTPLPFVSASSSASIYMEKMSAAIKFEYGRDQDVPLSYKLAGDLVSAKSDMSEMIEELEKGSVAIKTGND
jgi:Pathogenicity factor.